MHNVYLLKRRPKVYTLSPSCPQIKHCCHANFESVGVAEKVPGQIKGWWVHKHPTISLEKNLIYVAAVWVKVWWNIQRGYGGERHTISCKTQVKVTHSTLSDIVQLSESTMCHMLLLPYHHCQSQGPSSKVQVVPPDFAQAWMMKISSWIQCWLMLPSLVWWCHCLDCDDGCTCTPEPRSVEYSSEAKQPFQSADVITLYLGSWSLLFSLSI